MNDRAGNRGGRSPTYADVQIDQSWATFEGFLSNPPSGEFEIGKCLARYGDLGHYTPENCRWLTKSENSREMVERTMLRMDDGRFALDIARSKGIKDHVFRSRVARGWTVEKAATIPPGLLYYPKRNTRG